MTIVGPLFWKELIESARRLRYFAVRLLVAAVVLTTLLTLSQPLAQNQVSELATIGRSLLEQWAWIQLSALVIFVPAFASGLVAGEKDRKTIDALFTSCLTDREILWGKLASRLYVTVVIVASSIPVIVLLSFLGGFGPKELIDHALVQIATSVLCAAVGMYYSVISSKPYVALIRAYFVLLVVWLLIPGLSVPLQSLLPRIGLVGGKISLDDIAIFVFMCLNPFLWLRFQNSSAVAAALKWLPAAYIFVVLALITSAVLLHRSHRILREAAGWQHVPRLWRWLTECYRWLVHSAGVAVERRRNRGFWRKLWDWELKSRLWGSWERRYGLDVNPLFYRRATANVYDPERYIAGLQALAWLAVLSVVFFGGYVMHELIAEAQNFVIFLGAELPLLVLVLVILASSSIAREADRGSLDLLLLTPLSAGELLVGTIWGVLRTAWPMLALVVLTMILGGLATLHEDALIVWVLTLIPMLLCLLGGSMLISLVARGTMTAVICALAAPVFFVAVPAVLETLPIGRGRGILHLVLGAVLLLLVFRVTGRRQSLFGGTALTILIPLLCLLAAYTMNGGWSGPPTRGSSWNAWNYMRSQEGPWPQINYARWLLGPLFDRINYTYYYGDSISALQFGFAQTVAAVWLFSLALKNLDLMLGRPVPWQRFISGAKAEAQFDAADRANRAGGLPVADRMRGQMTNT